jgi:Protein of unknown function (DUF1348)
MGFLGLVSEALFRCLLFLGECEALSFFPASCAFLSVVSAFAVSHKSSTVAFLSCRGKLVALGDCHCYRILLHQAGGCVFRPGCWIDFGADFGQGYRAYGNQNREFDENGLMRRWFPSINGLPIKAIDRKSRGSAKFDLAMFYLPECLHTKTTVKIFCHA